MPANLIHKHYETLDAEHDFVPYVPLDDSVVDATHEKMIEIVKRMLKDMSNEAPPSPKVVEDAREHYQERLHHDFTSDDGASQSHQSQSNSGTPTGVQGPLSSPPPTFGIFHSSGSPDSPHFLAPDLDGLPSASDISWAFISMCSALLAPVTGKRPYPRGTYAPRSRRPSAVTASSSASLTSTTVEPGDRARYRTDATVSFPSSSTSSSKAVQPSDTHRHPNIFPVLPSFKLDGSASTGLQHHLPTIDEDEGDDDDDHSRKKHRWEDYL